MVLLAHHRVLSSLRMSVRVCVSRREPDVVWPNPSSHSYCSGRFDGSVTVSSSSLKCEEVLKVLGCDVASSPQVTSLTKLTFSLF